MNNEIEQLEEDIVLSTEINKEFLNTSKEQMTEYIFFLVTRVKELEEELADARTTTNLIKDLTNTYGEALGEISNIISNATNSKGFLS